MSQLTADDVIVLPARDREDHALVLGRPRPLPSLGEDVSVVPSGAVSSLIDSAGLAAHGLAAAEAVSGRWVQLTKESAAQLVRLGETLDANGVPMGVLRGNGGHFEHVLRFESLGAAPVAATSLLGGMAVQLALMRIEQSLRELTERVDLLIEGSQIEVEAELAAALSVLGRLERRAMDRGTIDGADWTSLAAIEAPIKAAYHQTVRWLDPLRDFFADRQFSLVHEVRALKANLGLRDIGFWLRMYVHGELAMKRWEALYLLHEAVAAPERMQHEAERIADDASERHRTLLDLHDQIAVYLDADRIDSTWLDNIRLLSKSRLRQLRVELAAATNAYGSALGQLEVDVPAYGVDELNARQGPLIDLDELRRRVPLSATAALESGTGTARDVGRWVGDSTAAAVRRFRRRTSADADDV